MAEMFEFPPTLSFKPSPDTVVVEVFASMLPDYFDLVILDPEFGRSEIVKYSKPQVDREIIVLQDEATVRGLKFFVDDHSAKRQRLIYNDDNRPPERG